MTPYDRDPAAPVSFAAAPLYPQEPSPAAPASPPQRRSRRPTPPDDIEPPRMLRRRSPRLTSGSHPAMRQRSMPLGCRQAGAQRSDGGGAMVVIRRPARARRLRYPDCLPSVGSRPQLYLRGDRPRRVGCAQIRPPHAGPAQRLSRVVDVGSAVRPGMASNGPYYY
jgi:hypothetical protein